MYVLFATQLNQKPRLNPVSDKRNFTIFKWKTFKRQEPATV